MICVLIIRSISYLPQLHAQGTNDAIIYLDSSQQVIRGFGAANIRPWRPDMTAGEVQKAFGTGPGEIGLTLLRLRVPYQASEFALNVPTAQAAHSMGVTIIASPWTPPPSMKTNNNIVGGRLRETSYASYAAHLKSFVDFMAASGVPIYAISVQNEPDIQVTYESCDWNASEMVTFVKDHGRDVGTKLIAPESFNFNPTIADAILNDSAAAANLDIVGGHIYGGGLVPYPLAAAKGKELWMTEHLVLDTSWTAVLGTGKEIHDVMSAGMNAYIWWYIVRFYGPIDDGEGSGGPAAKGNVTRRGFVMSQFARFIRPGYVRILATYPPRRPVFVTAYKGESNIVIVAVNTGSSSAEQTFVFHNLPGGAAVFTPYVTSETKNCVQESEITVSDGRFTVTLDASSITTFVARDIPSALAGLEIPATFDLFQNYPNPFNPLTTIRYQLPAASHVTLKVFNVLGQEVATLVDQMQESGFKTVKFEPIGLPSGVYVYRLQANGLVQSRKMLLIR